MEISLRSKNTSALVFKLTLRRDPSPAKLQQDKNQLMWTRGWGGGNWDEFHCQITSGHGVCDGTCVLPRVERLSLRSVVKKTPCAGFSHFCGCSSFSCSEREGKRVLASVSWEHFHQHLPVLHGGRTCCLPPAGAVAALGTQSGKTRSLY